MSDDPYITRIALQAIAIVGASVEGDAESAFALADRAANSPDPEPRATILALADAVATLIRFVAEDAERDPVELMGRMGVDESTVQDAIRNHLRAVPDPDESDAEKPPG
jgi:hypothetical protein